MAARWNLDPFRGFEAGFRMRRNIEAVRMDMQDRENLKAAQAQMAAVQEEEEKSETRIRLQSSQETYRAMMRQLRDYGADHPDTPDREQIKAARNLMDENFFQLVGEKNQRYQTILNRYAGNKYVEQWIGGLLADNNLMAERFAQKLADGEQSLTQIQVQEMGGEREEAERAWQTREAERDRRSAERVATIQASRGKQFDPAETAANADDFVRNRYDEDEFDELAEPLGMTGKRLQRRMSDWVFKRFAQGQDPAIDQFLALELEGVEEKPAAETAPADDASYAHQAGRALRQVKPETIRKGAQHVFETVNPAVRIGREVRDFYRGWKEGAPLEEATEKVGAQTLGTGG